MWTAQFFLTSSVFCPWSVDYAKAAVSTTPHMNVIPVACMLASSIVCSGSAVWTSWYSQGLAFFPIVLLALVAFPAFVSAAPPTLPLGAHIDLDVHRRQDPSPSTNDSNTSISMNVWVRRAWFLPRRCRRCEVDGVLMFPGSLSSFLAVIASDSCHRRGVYALFVRDVRPSVCKSGCRRDELDCQPIGFHCCQWEHDTAASATP